MREANSLDARGHLAGGRRWHADSVEARFTERRDIRLQLWEQDLI